MFRQAPLGRWAKDLQSKSVRRGPHDAAIRLEALRGVPKVSVNIPTTEKKSKRGGVSDHWPKAKVRTIECFPRDLLLFEL